MSDLPVQFSKAYSVLFKSPQGGPLRELSEQELGQVLVVVAKLFAFMCSIVAYICLCHFSIMHALLASLFVCVGLDLMKISENCDYIYNEELFNSQAESSRFEHVFDGTFVCKSIRKYMHGRTAT